MTSKEELAQERWKCMSLIEQELWQQGINLVAGLDEAGRGPLAGPVAAAAVVLPSNCRIIGLNDSKKLTESSRLRLEPLIKEQALAWAVTAVNHRIIDEINILEASRWAMMKALANLSITPHYLLTDAIALPTSIPQKNIIHGDSLSISIAAASVLAKNYRDRIMVNFARLYPDYGFERHKGYPTKAHRQTIKELGLTPIHRRSFRIN
ncbi:MAG: ribonuclease HII [Clostridiales bacterium]|nr:ribonuclease HII [Clostridiales bacterium]